MKKLILTLMAGSLLILSSCTKEGPQGPQGPAGNANVIGEPQFTVSSWQKSGGVWYATFSDDNITNDVVANGAVEIYKEYSNGWTNLPDINGITSTVYNFLDGGFTISILNSDGSLPAAPGTVTFRVVVIPSSVRKAHPNTNWKNYNETMAVMNESKVVTAK